MAATAAIIISNSIIFYYNIPILLHCTDVVYCMTLPYMISSCLLYFITYCITSTIGVGTLTRVGWVREVGKGLSARTKDQQS